MKEKKMKEIKAVYSLHIDFKYKEGEGERYTLKPGHSYNLNNNVKVSYNDIVNGVIEIINTELEKELKKYDSLFVKKIEYVETFEGSIEILFTAILQVLDVAGNLMSLYDIVKLIKDITDRFMNKQLKKYYGDHFFATTSILAPNRDYWRFEHGREKIQVKRERGLRDAFFYYLLIANIVLLIIVAVLVAGAVKTVYFP